MYAYAAIRQDRVTTVVETADPYQCPSKLIPGKADTYRPMPPDWQAGLEAEGYTVELISRGYDQHGSALNRYRLTAPSIGADGLPL